MKNSNKPKSQYLSQLHFNTFLKASPEAMDALMNAEGEEAFPLKKIPTFEIAQGRLHTSMTVLQ